jgi:hypothetical protein
MFAFASIILLLARYIYCTIQVTALTPTAPVLIYKVAHRLEDILQRPVKLHSK